jgi:transposase-like protein
MEYEDFYDNYTEFDLQINDFKKVLATEVRKEFLDRMNKLEKENSQLQEVKANWEKLVADYRHKEYLLEQEKNNAKSEAKRTRLEELIGDKKIILYRPKSDYIEKPKCDKCNSERELEYKSPTGRAMFEKCECSIKNTVYSYSACAKVKPPIDKKRNRCHDTL